MKKILSLATTLVIGSTLALTACGKDKKASTTTEPAKTEPAATEATGSATDPAKPEEKKEEPKAGW